MSTAQTDTGGWETADEGFPDTWEPKEGDVIEGNLIEVRTVPTRYGDKPKALLDVGNNKQIELWIGGASIDRQWKKLNPQQGDTVKVKFEGSITTNSGNRMNAYKVAVKRNEPF